MPLYEYRCAECSREFELLRPMDMSPRRPTALRAESRQLGYCRYSPHRRPAGLASRGLSPAWVEAVAVVGRMLRRSVWLDWLTRGATA